MHLLVPLVTSGITLEFDLPSAVVDHGEPPPAPEPVHAPPPVPEQDTLIAMPKRTYQPNRLKRKRTHGFLRRLKTRGGRKILERRRAKGRHRIAVT